MGDVDFCAIAMMEDGMDDVSPSSDDDDDDNVNSSTEPTTTLAAMMLGDGVILSR